VLGPLVNETSFARESDSELSFLVLRDLDLLNVEFRFLGFQIRGKMLEPRGGAQARILMVFPPQNLAEQIFELPPFDASHPDTNWEIPPLDPLKYPDAQPPVRSLLSGPSWLAFQYDERHGALPLDPDVWLRVISDPIRASLISPPAALDPKVALDPVSGEVVPRPPRDDETALELPFRLFIAPSVPTAVKPSEFVEGPGFHGLWHVTLRSRVPVAPSQLPQDLAKAPLPPELQPPKRVTLKARPFYSPDHERSGEPPFSRYFPKEIQLSLHAFTRHALVEQILGGDGIIDVERLELTPLGANASLYYASQAAIDDLEKQQMMEDDPGTKDGGNAVPSPSRTHLYVWRHRIVIGRDAFIAEASFGWLFPFQIPSLYVELTERKFASRKPDGWALMAALVKRQFIIRLRDKRQFLGSESPHGREMPLKVAVLNTVQSPNLRSPTIQKGSEPIDNLADRRNDDGSENVLKGRGLYFWPKDQYDKDVSWDVDTQDEAGQHQHTSEARLFFASHVKIGRRLFANQRKETRTMSFPSSKIAFAPQEPLVHVPFAAALPVVSVLGLDAAAEQRFRRLSEFIGRRLLDTQGQFRGELAELHGQVHAIVDEALRDATGWLEEDRRQMQTFVGQELQKLDDAAKQKEEYVNRARAFGHQLTNWDELQWLVPDELRAAAQAVGERLLPDLQGTQVGEEINGKFQAACDAAKQAVTQTGGWTGADVEAIQRDASIFFDRIKKPLVAEEFAAQLRRVHDLNSTLETKAITFGSELLGDELAGGKQLIEALRQVASDPERKAIFDDPKAWVEKQATTFAQAARDRLANKLTYLKTAAENETEFFDRAQQYLNELDSARQRADDIGTRAVHATVESAQAIIPALKGVAPNVPIREIELLGDYVTGNFQRAKNGAFARLTETIDEGRKLEEAVKNGIGTPAMTVAGISRELGALAGKGKEAVDHLARKIGGDEIKKVFEDALGDAKLFGCLPLSKLLGAIVRGKMPTLNTLELPDQVQRTYEWLAPLNRQDFSILTFLVKNEGKCHFRLFTRTTLSLRGGSGGKPEGRVELDGYLGDYDTVGAKKLPHEDDNDYSFALNLLQLIEARFKRVELTASYRTGDPPPSPNVEPKLGTVEFLGPLKFVKTLEDTLGDLFGGGFKLTIDSSYLAAQLGFAIPPVSFGAFSLRNIVFWAQLRLPFSRDPLWFGFAVSSFAKPFELSVMGFAGRGFLSIEFDTTGRRALQGMFEFGGALSFDIGVASGGLYVTAGIYYSATNGMTDLSGFLRAGGNLDVLSLVHVSIEFLLGMKYREEEQRHLLYGFCRVTVSIDVFFCSFDVSLDMEKRLAGGDSGHAAAAITDRRANEQIQLGPPESELGNRIKPPPWRRFVGLNANDTKARFRDTKDFLEHYWNYFC